MILFVTGIDTGVGKTESTGWLASRLRREGLVVTTMKLVQTGCRGPSEDLQRHRALMEAPWDALDRQGLTCPQIFRFPASPHLAARLEGRQVDLEAIDRAIAEVSRRFPLVLLEGAGGIEVPLAGRYTILDFVAERRYPTLVVTSPRLGSINHTLLTVRALLGRGIEVRALLYNRFAEERPEIAEDTRGVLQRFFPQVPILDVPPLQAGQPEVAPDRQLLRRIGRCRRRARPR